MLLLHLIRHLNYFGLNQWVWVELAFLVGDDHGFKLAVVVVGGAIAVA